VKLAYDTSLTVLRVSPERFAQLPKLARDMLQTYVSASWTEDGILAFRIATHRVNGILAACGLAAPPTSALASAESAVSAMLDAGRRPCKDR
jgi:hypothetical protein